MTLGGESLAVLVVVGGVVQTVYYTILIGVLAARLSSRIAIMEFKVDELWARVSSDREVA